MSALVPISILWVDDEPDWPELFAERIIQPLAKEYGYAFSFRFVRSIEEAMRLLEMPSHGFNVVLLDLRYSNHPPRTAEDTIKLLPGLSKLWPPIDVVTGMETASMDTLCIEQGADAVLFKRQIEMMPDLAVQKIKDSHARRKRDGR